MKPRFLLSPEAARDIREIWSYIADDNIRAAIGDYVADLVVAR